MSAEFGKAYCIKDYYDNMGKLKFTKDRYYNTKRYLSKSHNDYILISSVDNLEFVPDPRIIEIFDMNPKPDYNSKEWKDFWERFPDGIGGDPSYPYFVDYFASKKELRNLKLNEINEKGR
jgi:hypothetical protein